jgi:hypothetical protein
MNNIVVNVAGGGANVVNGANGVPIVWPGHGVWTIVLGLPVGAGPVVSNLYDINAPAHASGNPKPSRASSTPATPTSSGKPALTFLTGLISRSSRGFR